MMTTDFGQLYLALIATMRYDSAHPSTSQTHPTQRVYKLHPKYSFEAVKPSASLYCALI